MKGKLTLELHEDACFIFDRKGELKGVGVEVIDRENTYKLPKGTYAVDNIQGNRVFLIDTNTNERTPIMREDFQMLVNHLDELFPTCGECLKKSLINYNKGQTEWKPLQKKLFNQSLRK